MKLPEREKATAWVARNLGTVREEDAQGRLTGRNVASYAEPEAFRAVVSPARGQAANEMFGTSAEYDCTITVADPVFEVGEADALYVDADPADGGGQDHKVVRVARSRFHTVIAAKRLKSAGAA